MPAPTLPRHPKGPARVASTGAVLSAVLAAALAAPPAAAAPPAPPVAPAGASSPSSSSPSSSVPSSPVPSSSRPSSPGASPTPRDLGREVLPAGDGWASWTGTTRPEGRAVEATGTTGGGAADPAEVYVVDTWTQLRDALAGRPGGSQTDARTSTTPRIVYVRGMLDAFVRADGTRVTCADLAAQVTVAGTGAPFSMDDYVAHYDPSGPWGREDPSGPLEEARVAAAALQARQTQQHVGSNVTIVGVGEDAGLVGANLRVRDAANVVVRNLRLSDAYDCFPQWDPGDGESGSWNSAYDNLSVWSSTSVWADHLTLDDGEHPPASLPAVYGRPFEVHDGLLDVTHGSDLVTVSWNHFLDHDKTSIVGSSDSRLQDRGQHRVTYHHNRWTDVGQRAPRVRFGDVHVYNDLYEQTRPGLFSYYWGAGVESSLVVENTAVELAPGVEPGRVVAEWKGTQLQETGTLVDGVPVDVVAAFNATAPRPLADTARWTPADHYSPAVQPTEQVAATVRAGAGATLPSGTPVASSAPDAPRLSHDNGWDTGLHDGDFTVTSTLWWGQNATVVRFWEDDVLVDAQWLDGTSPGRQTARLDITGKPDGTYTYVAEVLNPWGTARSAPLTVTVRDAAPARPTVAAGAVVDGTVTVTTTLWWGTNATEHVLLVDGVEAARQPLVDATPHRQRVTTTLTGLVPGTHTVVARLTNAAGSTDSAPLRVTVRR